jgi:uncharacterized membrane protein
MEILYILIVAALLVWMRNSLFNEVRKIRLDLFNIQEMLYKQQEQTERPPVGAQQEAPVPPQASIKEEPQTEITEEYFEETVVIESAAPLQPYNFPREEKKQEEEKVEEPVYYSFNEPVQSEEPKLSFFDRHPDLEKFIGENIINKIGIGILVLGIAFFVKYAIDQNWINEIGRTSIGVLAGGLLIGIAHRLHQSFKAFSSVLIGGGLAVLYFTIAISFHEYKLFSQTSAFVIMVVITAFAVLLSIAYDRKELAILAIIGGFSTPFILSTGEGNYQVLFSYLLILNTGMLALAFKKNWTAVTLTCYVFTILIFGGWIVSDCLQFENHVHMPTLLFGAMFYLIFFLMGIIFNVKNNVRFRAAEISVLLSNTFLFYAAGMALLFYGGHSTWQGLFTVTLGVINFLFAYFLYKRSDIDKNLVFLLIGLVLTFISLAAPVQLEGNYITMFWAVEAVLLLWFSQKSGIELIRNTSLVIFGLMFISLLMDWINLYGDYSEVTMLEVVLNKPFITGIISLAAVFIYHKLISAETVTHFMWQRVEVKLLKQFTFMLMMLLTYLVLLLEINYQMNSRVGYEQATNLVLGIYNFLFIAIGWIIGRRQMTAKALYLFPVAVLFLMLIYIGCYNESIITIRNDFLNQHPLAGIFFKLHFLIFILALFAVNIFYRTTKDINEINFARASKWITALMAVYLLSAELDHIVLWLSFKKDIYIATIIQQIHKAGYSVLWGCISFLLIRVGMKHKDRDIRIIALSLFTLTILKLFIFDIQGISEGGKILAFISLGILLLVVSFMYQRLKKLILEDGIKTAMENDKKNEEGI